MNIRAGLGEYVLQTHNKKLFLKIQWGGLNPPPLTPPLGTPVNRNPYTERGCMWHNPAYRLRIYGFMEMERTPGPRKVGKGQGKGGYGRDWNKKKGLEKRGTKMGGCRWKWTDPPDFWTAVYVAWQRWLSLWWDGTRAGSVPKGRKIECRYSTSWLRYCCLCRSQST